MGFFSALIGPAIGIVSGLISSSSKKKAQKKAQAAQDAANAENEERFQKILADFVKRERQARGEFRTVERSGVAELTRKGQEARSQSQQSLVSRGLANTSRLETEREGIGSRTTEAIQRLRAQFAANKINTLGQFSRERLAFEERKNVQGPSAAELAAIQGLPSGTDKLVSGVGDIVGLLGKSIFGGGGGSVQKTSFFANAAGDFFRNRGGF